MEAAPLPIDEPARLAALARYDILDTPAEAAFDDLTAIAAQACGFPIALLSFIARDRQWCKSQFGIDGPAPGRDEEFCAHAILQHDIFDVEDAVQDVRFAIPAAHPWGPVYVTPKDAHWAPPDGPRNVVLSAAARTASTAPVARAASPAR